MAREQSNTQYGAQPEEFTQEQLEAPPVNPPSNITPAPNGSQVQVGHFSSATYRKGVSGWDMDSEGNVEFNQGTFRGSLQIGGTVVTVTTVAQVQPAINRVSAAGGGTVNLAPGTYNFTTSITIPNGVNFAGAGATIDFGGGARQILVQGTSGYTTGTLSVTHGSTTVTGVGTTWTAAMIGRSILLGEAWYTITARASNTSLTVNRVYQGITLSGEIYAIAVTANAISLTGFTVQNSSISLIKAIYTNVFTIDGVAAVTGLIGFDISYSSTISILNSQVDSCGTGMYIFKGPFGALFNSSVTNSTSGGGIIMLNSVNWGLGIFGTENITGPGLQFTNCNDLGLENFSVIHTTGIGIEFVSTCDSIGIVDGYVVYNSSDGIKFDASTTGIELIANTLTNNGGYGVNVAASSCVGNIISSCYFASNTSGALNDLGTGTVIRGNYGITDGQSFVSMESISVNDAVSILSEDLVLDLSGNNNHLLNKGSMTYGTGVLGQAALPRVTGNKYLSIIDSLTTGLNFTSDCSFAFWLKCTSVTDATYHMIIDKCPAGFGTPYSVRQINGDVLFSQGGGNSGGGLFNMAAATWYHVVVTYLASSPLVTFYKNGVSVGTSSAGYTTSITPTTDALLVGNGQAGTLPFDGSLDEVGIWGKVLSAGEVTALYNSAAGLAYPFAGTSSLLTSLKAYWSMDTVNLGTLGTIGRSSAADTSWRYSNFIGFASNTIAAQAASPIQLTGLATFPASLTTGSTYYLSNTPGAIATSAGTNSKKVGRAYSTSLLSIQLPPL